MSDQTKTASQPSSWKNYDSKKNKHKTDNFTKNREALKKMTEAQKLTGMTVEELAGQQRQLKSDFLRRLQNRREEENQFDDRLAA